MPSGPALPQESQRQGHTVRNILEPPTVSMRQLRDSGSPAPTHTTPVRHSHINTPSPRPTRSRTCRQPESHGMLAAGAGQGRWRDHLPGAKPVWVPLPPGPSESLSDFLPACLCLSVSVACLSQSLSRLTPFLEASWLGSDLSCWSPWLESLALHRCWVQHNSTPGPLGLWNCLSPSHPVCLSLSLSSPSHGALILIHFWELMSHPGSLILLLVL